MKRNKLMNLLKSDAVGSCFAKVEENETEATVYLYDCIGGWCGIEAEQLVRDIAAIKADTINLRVHSPGGDVFDACAIQTALKRHPANVIAHIDGMAASAATLVVMGADEIEIAESGFFMIHNPWGIQIGDAEDMRRYADLMDKIRATMVADYNRKTGLDAEEITAMLEAETWMNAQEALDNGFVDRIFEGEEVENHYNIAVFDNAPEALLKNKDNGSGDSIQAEAESIQEQLKRRIDFYDDFGN